MRRLAYVGSRFMRLAARTLRSLDQVLGAAAACLDRLVNRLNHHDGGFAGWPSHNELVIRTMTEYDMVARPDEPYYARQYLHWILPELAARYPQRRVRILDLGCAQGRLSLPLAEWCAMDGGHVVGVDFTPAAIAQAREYAVARGIRNVSFHQEDLLAFATGTGESSADAILLIEVPFILPSCREVLLEVRRVLRPDGVAFVAFRSQYYNLLHTVRNRLWDGADMALANREGHIFGGPGWFTWQTPEDIRRLLTDSGLRLLKLRGIGLCSGIEGDPLAGIARPSQLQNLEQERLMAVECAVAEQYAACGRYALATAERMPRAAL